MKPLPLLACLAACTGSISGDRPQADDLSASEMEPVTYRLYGAPAQLPRGASFDGTHLHWIPRKGQAGRHVLSGAGVDGNDVVIHVEAVPESIFSEGPPVAYDDDEVGYIFIHGKDKADNCQDKDNLDTYWADSLGVIAPNPTYRTVACYDGREGVTGQADRVVDQILEAPCGTHNACIAITHSMGGLMLEHILARAANEPGNRRYEQARDKLLLAVSLASAAGGSKVADILESPGDFDFVTEIIGELARWLDMDNKSSEELQIHMATTVIAPVDVDPGIPFFMVPAFSESIVQDPEVLLDYVNDGLDSDLFFGVLDAAILDFVADFDSRSDGVVALRSACGTRSTRADDGPGRSASLAQNLEYCAQSEKKPNHYVWFLSNLEHRLIARPNQACVDGRRCKTLFLSNDGSTFETDETMRAKSPVEVIASGLRRPR